MEDEIFFSQVALRGRNIKTWLIAFFAGKKGFTLPKERHSAGAQLCMGFRKGCSEAHGFLKELEHE